MAPDFAFAHEIGHNFGCGHDSYDEPGYYDYSHGHVNLIGSRYRTVMAADAVGAGGAVGL